MATDVSLFDPELCFFGWDCASSNDLFSRLNEILRARGNVNAGWLDGITTRERVYPTGLRVPSAGIAIPHTSPEFIEKPYIAVVRPKEPVLFGAMAGMGDPVPAEIILNLGIVRDGGQVAVLQNLMAIFTDESKTADILSQTTGAGMVTALTKYFE